jgi:hypothetical protein
MAKGRVTGDRDSKWWIDVASAATKWKFARQLVIDASIYPIGNEAYRARLNQLSEAEDRLSKAIGPMELIVTDTKTGENFTVEAK